MMQRIKRWLQRDAVPAVPAETPAGGPVTTRILMVCMGNICRSPTAEGVLRDKLRRAGLAGRVSVDSAGTHGYHTGEAPDPRAIRHAAQRGYDIASQRARAIGAADFMRFDWVLAMDEENMAALEEQAPVGHTARIELLMPYATQHRGVVAVPDPYYGTAAGFEHVLDLLEDACDGVVARLLTQGPIERDHGPIERDSAGNSVQA